MKISKVYEAVFITAFLAATTAIPTAAFATIRNPQIRECTRSLGLFEVYPLGTGDMGLCRWGAVVIDAMTLVQNVDTPRVLSQAANAVLGDLTTTSCAAASASDDVIPTGETICFFSDGSKLSLEGLKAGLSNADRVHLKEVIIAR